MEPFEKWSLLRSFLHWHSISKTRGKALRFLREPTKRWRQWARQEARLRDNEKRARRAIRACRINNALELCLTQLAQSRIASASEVGRWLETKQPAHVPIANRIDHLLDEYESGHNQDGGAAEETETKHKTQSSPKQLHIQGKVVTLSADDLAGLMALKQFHWLLLQFGEHGREDTINTVINPQPIQTTSSPIGRLTNHLSHSGVVGIGQGFDNPSTLPEVHVLVLILLADEIKCALEKFNKSNPNLKKDLLEQHYFATGLEDTFVESSHLILDNNHEPSNQARIDAMTMDIDLDVGTDDLFDFEEGELFAKYLTEISAGEKTNSFAKTEDAEQTSLVDALAADIETNISVMKLDVDTALRDTQSSQTHLVNYKEFIEKKKKQRVQCLRYIQSHCCTCRGPHISKAPFSHGKDYRREPLHPKHQGNKCIFLKKKRSELKWLDDTLGNYSRNNNRFERAIEKRNAETESRKENMKEALGNSLRLLALASD